MAPNPVDWKGAVSFEQRVIRLFKAGEFQSVEFQLYIKMFGRDRLKVIWDKYKNGDYSLPDPEDAAPNQPTPSAPQSKREQSAKKATSFVEKSCPNDDF